MLPPIIMVSLTWFVANPIVLRKFLAICLSDTNDITSPAFIIKSPLGIYTSPPRSIAHISISLVMFLPRYAMLSSLRILSAGTLNLTSSA